MAIAPKRLFIPNKATGKQGQPEYGTDMRAIENFNPINQIIPGTGITVSPTDGTGPSVTINSSGGGGTGIGFMTITMAPDINDTPLFLGPSDPSSIGDTYVQLFSNSSGGLQFYTFASSWIVAPSAGDSIDLLPIFQAPIFTGGGIGLEWTLNAVGWDLANSGQVTSNLVTITSGATIQPPTSDYGSPSLTSDLTFVNGTGNSGNGFVTAGGETAYIASVSGRIDVQNGTTF